MTIEALLRRHVATGDARPLEIARRSLDAMAAGGIHDQLGGGFHRYSTDAQWLVPHFEQMLYDNAQLARVYVHAWALTRRPRATSRPATGTLDYLLRELRTPDGGFAASQDADTDGEEGATFVWSAAEIREVLGDDAALVRRRLRRDRRRQLGGSHDPVPGPRRRGARRAVRAPGRGRSAARLAAARGRCCWSGASSRSQPARDDKVLAAWNGLAIAALADAARALGADR